MTKPGYKMTEIGEIPEEWNLVTAGQIIEYFKGKNPRNIIAYPTNGYAPYLSTDYLRNESNQQYAEITDEANFVNNGDIILLWDGSNAGEVFLGKEGILSSTMVKLHIKVQNIDTRFLLYLLKLNEKHLRSQTKGTSIPHIDKHVFENLSLLLPPLPEQQKIAEILTTVDKKIEFIDQEILAAERVKKGLMQILLTKGIGHTKFKMTEIGEMPEEWKLSNLTSISENKNDIVAGPFGSNLKVSDYTEVGVPIIRLQNIAPNSFIYKDIRYIRKEKAEELAYHSFMAGDIVLAKLGDPIGVSCIVPPELSNGIVVADVVRIRVSDKKADKRFVVQSLNSPICLQQLRSAKIGSTRARVNLSDVRNLRLFIPPLPEQQRIAEILTTADRKIELLKEKKQKAESLKKGLMQVLLTGQVRVKVDKKEMNTNV